jgi:hypothetical protein
MVSRARDPDESLKAAMEAELPGYHGAMVRSTEHTCVQLIYTARMPAYHRGPACLIGDADRLLALGDQMEHAFIWKYPI